MTQIPNSPPAAAPGTSGSTTAPETPETQAAPETITPLYLRGVERDQAMFVIIARLPHGGDTLIGKGYRDYDWRTDWDVEGESDARTLKSYYKLIRKYCEVPVREIPPKALAQMLVELKLRTHLVPTLDPHGTVFLHRETQSPSDIRTRSPRPGGARGTGCTVKIWI
mgnify:CR=1 FL=1